MIRNLFWILVIVICSCGNPDNNYENRSNVLSDTFDVSSDFDSIETKSLKEKLDYYPDTFYHADRMIICDSTFYTDLPNNLVLTQDSIPSLIKKAIRLEAIDYFENACKQDSLYCDSFELKMIKNYKLNDLGLNFSLSGFAFRNGGYEKESASLFILSVYEKDKLYWTEINADLIGEIKMDLKGASRDKNYYKVWGEMYPYMDFVGYGKFLLTKDGKKVNYKFECNID